jgi:hypothetical protein
MSAKLSVVAQATGVDLASKANAIGVALGKMQKALSEANLLKDTINKLIVELHKDKAKVGIYRKDGTGCALATAFVDGCVEAGLSHSTAQKTYLPTFKKAVESGKPVTDWNGQRAKKAKGGTASEPKSLANKLATCFRDADFEGFLNDLQESWDNAEIASLYEGIKSYLEAEGIKTDTE